MLNCSPWPVVDHTVHWFCLSSLHAAATQTKGKFCFLWVLQVPALPALPALLHTHSHTHTHTMFTDTSKVIGIMQKMGKEKSLAAGDSECPVWISEWQNLSAWEGVRLTVFPGGCSSNPVILSWQFRCVLHNTLPFLAADTEFTDKVANFHPYCPVKLNEKWTISLAGMRCCFGQACSNSFSGYITLRCCLASLWLCMKASVLTYCRWDQVHGLAWVGNFKLHQW